MFIGNLEEISLPLGRVGVGNTPFDKIIISSIDIIIMPRRTKMRKAPKTRISRPKASKAWYDKKYSTAELAGKAWTTAKYLATLVNVETKTIDVAPTAVANTSFTSTGLVVYLSGTAQGNDFNNRDGNSIKSQYMNLLVTITKGSSNNNCRVILFRDRENRQALPAPADVLESVDPRAQYNHTNLDRFTILKDSFFLIDDQRPTRVIEFSKADRTHIRYEGTTAGVADADENNIFILFLSDTASGATSPSAVFGFRLGFVDN